MSEIMPIKREDIENELNAEHQRRAEAENIELKIEEADTLEEEPKEESAHEGEEEEENTSKTVAEDQFIKPKKKEEVVISKKTGKPKRKLTEKQLENLKKAREKSQARRKELKESKDIEKKAKQLKREKEKEERLKKREKSEEMIALKAQLKLEAEQEGSWTEERLQGLIDSSIDKYIEKKKAMKPQPRSVIPPPRNPHTIGNQPLDPKYYMPQNSANYYNQQYNPRQQQQYHQPPSSKDPTLSSLFGNYE